MAAEPLDPAPAEATAAAPHAPGNEFEFRAQVQRVLSLVINSLYTHSEVFLRELVSNASDALDKARYLQLTDRDQLTEQQGEPSIDIRLDASAGTLTIEDNGVGMTRDEAVENLGTIARSGTDEFIKRFADATKKKDTEGALDLIGQFGVGFYAAFMVASRVDVETLSMKKGAEPVLWRSSGSGTFHVLPGERTLPGTRIVLHLKDDSKEFAQKWRVEEVIRKYSDFVMFPIRVDGEVVNRSAALWRMPRGQVTEEQHREFFKHITQGRWGDEPLATIHLSVDAPVQYSALLYVPSRAPLDLFSVQRGRPGLRLYARRVLIMENCEALSPVYLRFVRGVVDSEDVQLNVSRETLQEDRTIKHLEQQIVKAVLKELEALSERNDEAYRTFWRAFGQVLKEGVTLDWKNKDALAALCRFTTLNQPADALVSLTSYLAAKPEDQKAIWYLTGPSREQLEKSPHLEVFRKRGLDVLLLVDPIDEWLVKSLTEYQGVPLKSAAHGDLDLDSEESSGDAAERFKDVLAAVKSALGDKVDEVRVSKRLTETASCLVAKAGDPGANLERLMKMIDDSAGQNKRVLELNPDHALVRNLAKLVEQNRDAPQIALWSEMLYDQALLSEGVVEDPARLVRRIQELLVESSARLVGEDQA
jgi:molecular chaperone HtpG